MFKISRFFNENPWRNNSSKLNIFGPLFPKMHSAVDVAVLVAKTVCAYIVHRSLKILFTVECKLKHFTL